ncbi:MAG: glycosyltransferase family 4 protein [FCB group bacterium]|nr:glycosyltransferase family 4 protein [FCB group bacterium]
MSAAQIPKILHIDTGSKYRGGQRQVHLLARHMARVGIEQAIACPSGCELSRRVDNIPLVELSAGSLARKLRLRPLREAILKYSINIVHAHDSEAHTIGLLLKARNPSLKLIVHRRVVFPPSSRFSGHLKYRGNVDCYIAISQAVAQSLLAAEVNEEIIEVISSGLDLEEIRRNSGDGFDPGDRIRKFKYLIVSTGSLTKEKDFPTAIRTMERVSGEIPEAALLILGEGPMDKKLVEMIVGRQLTNVHLLGHRETPAPIYAAADLFLVTSTSEGLNSSAIEAAACGLPLIASKVGGLPEIAEQNFNGTLCYPGQPESFAEAIIDLLRDKEKRKRMSANSIKKSAFFDIDRTGKKTIDLYHSLLVD